MSKNVEGVEIKKSLGFLRVCLRCCTKPRVLGFDNMGGLFSK
ncbi:hypothetical protein AAJ76_1290002469 [Vairimorpha ceranae]|uniref:Uncharacterized protein n=1 Tax=Vairimorpha ceranae TaxID=40302 RepID=A0A0F9Z7Y7_9MICR|nr:hypothetical protein AAJ76_1290002469 [Vairimorpha ceranae]KKO74049.1 hypothetical protein AAJ76_1290002469 [Vairimorpha ceranae]